MKKKPHLPKWKQLLNKQRTQARSEGHDQMVVHQKRRDALIDENTNRGQSKPAPSGTYNRYAEMLNSWAGRDQAIEQAKAAKEREFLALREQSEELAQLAGAPPPSKATSQQVIKGRPLAKRKVSRARLIKRKT